jgi:type VI protein secretion system component VasK
MRLGRLPAILLDDFTRKLSRRIIAAAIVVACAIGAIIEGVAAARLALEAAVGPVAARAILMGIFLLVIAITVGLLAWAEKRSARAAAARARAQEDPRATIIAEAVSVGYSLGRDFMNASKGEAPDTAAAEAEMKAKSEAKGEPAPH